MVLICTRCKNEFQRPTKWVSANRCHGTLPYCSRKCSDAAHKKQVMLNCDECRKEISKQQSKFNRAEKHFCSKQCANTFRGRLIRGINHPYYKSGISSYRKRALEQYGEKCTICGYSISSVLEVHHRDKNRNNNVMQNLDVLCPTHHVEYEIGIRKYDG